MRFYRTIPEGTIVSHEELTEMRKVRQVDFVPEQGKLEFVKVNGFTHSGLSDPIHEQVMSAFKDSLESGMEFCNEKGYNVKIKNGLMNVTEHTQHGFSFSAYVVRRYFCPDCNYELKYGAAQWVCLNQMCSTTVVDIES